MRATVVGIERFCNLVQAHVSCDECKAVYRCLNHYKYSDRTQVRADLVAAGWLVSGDHHVCPECA